MSSSSQNKKKISCNCAPYPTIDLSPIFTSQQYNQDEDDQISINIQRLRDEVKHACSQYGCFHLTIDTSTSTLPLEIQQLLSPLKNGNEVKKTFDTLFDNDFIQLISSKCKESGKHSSTTTVQFNGEDDDIVFTATYRGRSAESGSEKSNVKQGEPKQSWELFRNHDSNSNEYSLETNDIVHPSLKEETEINTSRLQILQSFVRALHEVVVVLCLDVLNLPEKKFVCSQGIENKSKDLLRVFRYDALSTREEQLSNLGSSSHTDWGCMTAVWQDSTGGLQIYCHQHHCWNDVEVEDTENCNDSLVKLFIHVGDYLSLAMNSVIDENNNVKARECPDGQLQWASPTHRVLCPLRINEKTNSLNECRCSLVYFAYPPNGVSLFDAVKSLKKSNYSFDVDNNNPQQQNDEPVKNFPYSRFMVLNNQSTLRDENEDTDKDKIALDAFKSVAQRHFDKIIEDKWKQVQR